MKLFTNLVSLAVFLVGTYQAVSVVDGKAIVNIDGNNLKFEMRMALPLQSEASANGNSGKQEQPFPRSILIVPVPDAKNGGSTTSPVR